jgi:hypothetical protein
VAGASGGPLIVSATAQTLARCVEFQPFSAIDIL